MKKIILLIIASVLISSPVYGFGGRGIDGSTGSIAAYSVYNAKTDFGMKCDNSTDDTTAFQNAISTLYANGGGTLVIPIGTCRINSQIVVRNSNCTSYPHSSCTAAGTAGTQPPIRITGSGGDASGIGWLPTLNYNGSALDFRVGSGTAKFISVGSGKIEIDHLTITTSNTDSIPFMLFTNTTPYIHHVTFHGSQTSASASNDAILLGGTSTNIGNAETDAFQGYGATINENWFTNIRRAVYARTYANNIVVQNNTVGASCGFTTGSPFEIDGGDSLTENFILSNNTVELTYYRYGVKARKSMGSMFWANGWWDREDYLWGIYYLNDGINQFFIVDGVWKLQKDISAIIACADSACGVGNDGKTKITTSTAHKLTTGASVEIRGVVGTIEANGQHSITKIDADEFWINIDFANAYSSGGIVNVAKIPNAEAGDSSYTGQTGATVLGSGEPTKYSDSVNIIGGIATRNGRLGVNNYTGKEPYTYLDVNGIDQQNWKEDIAGINYGAAVIRGQNLSIALKQKGILDVEQSGSAKDAIGVGPSLTLSNNRGAFGVGSGVVAAGFKAGAASADNDRCNAYLDFYTHTGESCGSNTLTAKTRINPDGKWTYLVGQKVSVKGGTAPTIACSGCAGTPSVATGSSDHAGYFFTGTGCGSCTLTFTAAYGSQPTCVVSGDTSLTVACSAGSCAIADVSGNYNIVRTINYVCYGVNE